MGKYGLYSIGDSINTATMNSVKDIVNGHRFRFKWAQVETADGVYDFTYIKSQMDVVFNAGKYIWLQFNISPCKDAAGGNPADYNCPQYLFSAPYNVPKVYTSTSVAPRFYPYYLDTNFNAKYLAFIDAVIAWIATLPAPYQAKIILLLSSEGKTGDAGPYAGTVTNPAYAITDAAWKVHKQGLWLYIKASMDAAGIGTKLMINQGNDGDNFQWLLDNIVDGSGKSGDNSHNFDYAGSNNSAQRFRGLRDPSVYADFARILGGEFENTDQATYYLSNAKGYTLPFLAFNLHCNIAIINMAPSILIADRFAYSFYNEFADFRNDYEADKGFVLFRDKPDFDDTIRFPESTYQPVIDPSRLSGANGYTNKYNGIINSGKPDAVIADNITNLRVSFINPARIAAIIAAVPGATYATLTSDRDYDAVNSDFGFDVIKGNFSRYLDMYDPDGTSVGAWRVGYSSFDGRYTRKLTTAKGKWYFSTPLMNAANYQMVFKIRYYNAGVGQWALYYNNGTTKVNAGTVVTTNTDAYIEKVYTIADMQGGTQLTIPGTTAKADFTIEKISGDDIHFSMMRMYTIAVNVAPTNIPPVADAGPDQTLDAPVPFFTLSGSGTDTDGTVIGYNWIQTAGPTAVIVSFTSQTTNVTGPSGGNVLPGTYTYTLKVLDNLGAAGIEQVTIIVNPEVIPDPQPPVAVINGPMTGVINDVITFDGAPSYDNDGTVVSYLWSIDGPIDFTVDSTVAAAMNFSGKYPGVYNITLLVTDNDGLTDEKTWQITLTDPTIVESTLGGLPGKTFKYYLINETGLSYYLENGVIKTSSVPKPLDLTPDGWQELLIQWERNTKYHGINRNVSNQFAFVADGAKIIRNIFYNGTVKSILHLLIQKRALDIDDTTFGFVYRFLYKGQLDLTTFQHTDLQQGRKVQANIAEGDFSKYLKSFEDQVYEIPCNATTPGAIPVLNDGVEYNSILNYLLPDLISESGDFLGLKYAFPMQFLNNEGDSFNTYISSENYEPIGNVDDYVRDSPNYPFFTSKTISVRITANIRYQNNQPEVGGYTEFVYHYIQLSDGTKKYFANNLELALGAVVNVPIDMTFDIPAGQRFIMVFDADNNSSIHSAISVVSNDFKITYLSRLDPSLCYARRLSDVFAELVSKMTNGVYTTSSNLFELFKSFVLTSGDSIRGFDTSVIKISLNQIYSFETSILAGGLSYSGKIVEMEARSNYFDNSNPIHLGIVKNVKFSSANDYLFSTLKIGYKDQNYESVNGRQEYNTTAQYTSPVTELTKELNLISDVRADPYGIESLRLNFFLKPTTDSQSDNDTFALDIEDAPRIDGYYHLFRDTFDSIEGITSVDSAYNLRLRPSIALRRNGSLIRSMFHNMEDQSLLFQTSDKNQLLKTVKGSETIQDNANVKASTLDAPLVKPFIAEIDPSGLWNLVDLLTANPNRCFTFDLEREGNTFEGFNLKVAMAPNDRATQTFKLLLTPNNDLKKLI